MFDEYMKTGFTKEQWDRLNELDSQRSPILSAHAGLLKEIYLVSNRLDRLGYPPAPPSAPPLAAPPPASPPAHKPCTQASPELPPQPTSAPVPAPAPARSYPPSPSVETIEEVVNKQIYKPLRNIRKRPTEQKHRALKTVSRICVVEFLENSITWPPKLGGIYICFSRDEELDVWYTTMLNAIDALPYRT